MSHIYYPEDQPSAPEALEKALDSVNISALPDHQLRMLRASIDAKLPRDSLKDVNLEAELVSQYHRVLELQENTLANRDIPANQKAQVAAQVASVLQQLIKLQTDLDLATKLRLMEEALVESLQTLPEEARHMYFESYERLAQGKGL